MTDLRASVRATYDSAETGPRYWVRSTIDDRPVGDGTTPIADPFVRHWVRLSLLDLLRGVIRRGLTVEVTVGADRELMHDVLELDDQTLIAGRTRKAAFQQGMHQRLGAFAREADDRG